jgi:DeoR/GlpR family transcriptional regulator of sugar metabolism
MQKQERIEQVLQIIKSRKFCTVDELVQALHYSPATIRRDLTHLAQRKLVEKSYGGASYIGDWSFAVREHQHIAIKAHLCHAAEHLIQDGDTVFVDGTTTTYFLRDVLLKKQRLIVVTTNLKLAIELCDHGVTCFVPGGQLCDTTMLGGAMTADALESFSFDVAFLSPGKISHDGRFSIPEIFSGSTRTVLKNTQKCVCLYHKEKLISHLPFCFGRLGSFDTVISDAEYPAEFKTDFPNTKFILVE